MFDFMQNSTTVMRLPQPPNLLPPVPCVILLHVLPRALLESTAQPWQSSSFPAGSPLGQVLAGALCVARVPFTADIKQSPAAEHLLDQKCMLEIIKRSLDTNSLWQIPSLNCFLFVLYITWLYVKMFRSHGKNKVILLFISL